MKYNIVSHNFVYSVICWQYSSWRMGPKANEKPKKGGKVEQDFLEPSITQKKAARAGQNKATEEQRLRDRDAMMDMTDISSNYEYETIDDIKSKFATDKFGNTISKAKAAEDSKVELLRAAAKARRAEKEAAALAEAVESSLSVSDIALEPKVKPSKELNIEEVRAKFASGAKLTHKEKKLLGTFEKASATEAQVISEAQSGLSSFSISMQAQGSGAGEKRNIHLLFTSQTTTKVSNFLLACLTFLKTLPSPWC